MEKVVRKLARSYKYQLLYARAKDVGNIRFFKNDFDFSYIQLQFLQWLEIYNSLYLDLNSNEEYMSAEVISDDLRTEAYLLYKSKKRDTKEEKENKKVDTSGNLPSVIFKRK